MSEPPEATAPLGEWYANAIPLPFPGRWLVLYTHSASLLAIVVPGRALMTTLPAFVDRVPRLLRRIGIAPEIVELQEHGMEEGVFARAIDRSVLGSMNDQARYLKFAADDAGGFDQMDLDAIEVELSGTPQGALKYGFPREVAKAILAAASHSRHLA